MTSPPATATALPSPFDDVPNPSGIQPASATRQLVRDQVRALLSAAPSFHQLSAPDRASIEHHMVKVAGYAAECLRDDWAQSGRLGQRPVRVVRPVAALAAADEFAPAAADQVARITRATVQAISFPEFVADLIRGSFKAIVDSSIQQMEAYTRLLEDVAKTVDQFMADNITDNQARDWLVQRYPAEIALAPGEARLVAPHGTDDDTSPGWREALALPDDVDVGDEAAYEEVLVPAARRKLAQSRLQTLSMLVLMGINRIVVSGGKIRATMSFHVDTTDRAAQQRASDFDFRTSASGSYGFGPWSASASVSVGYVNSTRTQSDSQLNVAADLTGEVEIHFRSDVFPLERFVDSGGADAIRANTPVPENNPPPWGQSAPIRPEVAPRAPLTPVRPIGEMPAPPAAPVPPAPVRPAPANPVAPMKPTAPPKPAAPDKPAAPSKPPASAEPTASPRPAAPAEPPATVKPENPGAPAKAEAPAAIPTAPAQERGS
ncbi:hypothetical protein [Streptomyces sp. HUAS ZL42]|uniref:hypothetical protein n=1 Tax=Streptomyces sp. HUAS ZL42 TaxID=3231715 RepID=UPI00345E68FB